MAEEAEVIFSFGNVTVKVSRDDAGWLRKSWFVEPTLVDESLRKCVLNALVTGEPVKVSREMNVVVVATLAKIEAEGRLNTDGLRRLRDVAKTPMPLPEE